MRANHEQMTQMAKDFVLRGNSDLSVQFPDDYAELVSQIEEIQAQGGIVVGFGD